MSTSYEAAEEQRDELVEQVAREIQLRGLTGPAVHFLEASRPYRALGANAMAIDRLRRRASSSVSAATAKTQIAARGSRSTPGRKPSRYSAMA